MTLQIWDTAGQERYRSLRTPFYRGADVCLLNFAVNDPQSFEDLNMWKEEFFKYAQVDNHQDFCFIVIGNKVDLPERRVPRDQVLRL